MSAFVKLFQLPVPFTFKVPALGPVGVSSRISMPPPPVALDTRAMNQRLAFDAEITFLVDGVCLRLGCRLAATCLPDSLEPNPLPTR